MKIKKVDDKPMVIHTKRKAKLHTHEPKQAAIKGSNVYTVDRDPTKKKADKLCKEKIKIRAVVHKFTKKQVHIFLICTKKQISEI
ncbi:MAG: hypothetical protein GX234_05915 [Clostridiales bacterium]|nr:hypothetical protein [Clostridiales bacterium]